MLRERGREGAKGREGRGGDAAHGHVADCEVSLNQIMVQVGTSAGSSVVTSDEISRETATSSLTVDDSAEL